MRASLIGAIALVALALPASAAEPYRTGAATCDGWPRAPIGMAQGYCAGVVHAPPPKFAARELRFPRMMLQLDRRHWLVTDLYGWVNNRGGVYRIEVTGRRGPCPGRDGILATCLVPKAMVAKTLSGLSMPHTIARGPDGKIYVGEMSRIFRFNPDAANPQATIEPVVVGLPDNRLHANRHPLSAFIFDRNGDILVNVGAPTDQCAASARAGARRCEESEGDANTAGVRRYPYLGNGKWSARFSMFVRGLRNSLALVRHSSGTILQAENSIDFNAQHSPFEELNILRTGAHYGWPYCHDMMRVTPVWARAGIDCRNGVYEKPAQLLPPHAAPLSMLYYSGAMFPRLRGKLLMTWHGYRPAGARVVAYSVDAKGIPLVTPRARYWEYDPGGAPVARPYPGPASEPLILTPGWDKRAGTRPMGTPVGLAVADDGAIWVTEDKNATILRIAPDRP
jgi:glucose/arabinose dehydrogenase